MRRIRSRGAAILTGTVVVAALAACAPQQTSDPDLAELRVNVPAWALSGNWNPVTSTYLNTYTQPIQAVYESFIQLDPATFVWEPLLAAEYEIADDQLSMAIRLHEDVDFTDGTHLDAETAKRSFEYAMTGSNAGALTPFEVEIEVTGEYELVVTTQAAMGTDFLLYFGIVPLASPTAIEEDPTALESMPVGTGPYVLVEQVADVGVTFERNPGYRDPDSFPFDEIEFTIFADQVAGSNALKTGQIDAAGGVDPSFAADIESNGFELHLGSGSSFNLSWSDQAGTVVPALADARVRRAIAFSLDRASIIENIEYGYGTVISQVWGEGSPYHLEGADETYAFDPDTARDLMAEAGYADGFAVTIPSYPAQLRYEAVIAQSLADIGITVTFDSFPDVASWSAANASGDYALTFGNASDVWFTARGFTDVGGGEIGDLYEIVDHGTRQEAAEALQEIARIVLDEALVIPVSRTADIWATIPGVTVEPTIVNGWPVRLQGIQLAG